MVRGAPRIVLCGVVLCVCARQGFAFGDYAGRIPTPVEPFAVAYATSTDPAYSFLVVCQSSDGQAGRYAITAPEQMRQIEAMFNPVSAGDAIGLAWVGSEKALYWLVETIAAGSRTYTVQRTNIDGWSLSGTITLDVPGNVVLGEMTYVPARDALWVVDIANDRYISFDRKTGARLPNEFFSPVRHRDAGTAYGMGIEFVPLGPGYFDLLVGTLTDRRAARVIRVDLQGNPVGASYIVDIDDPNLRPVWPAGLAYCDGDKHFTAVADAGRHAILFFDTPAIQTFGVTNLQSAVTETSIDGEHAVESIMATFTWKNSANYDSIALEYRDPSTNDFVRVATAQGGATSISHELGKEGRSLFRLAPVTGSAEVPTSQIDVRTVAGSILGITSLASGGQAAQPFGVAMIEDEQGQTILVADVMARNGAANGVVRRFRRIDGETFQPLSSLAAPFAASYVVVGLEWDSAREQLVWLGLSGARDYEFAVTSAEGVVQATGLPFIRNPFLQDRLGDIAYDAQNAVFWAVSIDRHAICSFQRANDGNSFVATSAAVALPTSLPGERGTWGLPCGISIVPGAFADDTVLYVTMGQEADNAEVPPLGAGYVKRIVPMHRLAGKAPIVAGMPIDLELATGSPLLRGFAINMRGTPSVLLAAEDVGMLYEVRLRGDGPLFARGDVNADAKVDIADTAFLLAYLFKAGSPVPSCADTADINDNGTLNLGDALALLRHVFGLQSNVPLALPFNLCGTDAVADGISCVSYPVCQ